MAADVVHLMMWWCIVALALAGFVQGVLGFGFGILAMALLPLMLPVREASPLVVLLTAPLVVVSFCAHWRHFQWRDGWVLVLGTCAGVPIGVYLLTIAPGEMLLRLLGGVLLAFAIYELLSYRWQRYKIGLPPWSGVPVGVLSGITSGAFNAGGPPLVAYAYAQDWTKERVVALLQVVFMVNVTLRAVSMLNSGLFTAPVLQLAVQAAAPALLALLLGTLLLRRIATEKLRQFVFLFISAIALKYLIWS